VFLVSTARPLKADDGESCILPRNLLASLAEIFAQIGYRSTLSNVPEMGSGFSTGL
jgi:hypothetical protein